MAQLPLPPVPNTAIVEKNPTADGIWHRWFEQLRTRLTLPGQGIGSVTSVGGTGTVNGITLTGTVTESGNLTLGGTLAGVNLTTQVTGILPTANGGTGTTGAWSAWTPTRTGWTDVGSPTVTARYVKIANIVHFQIKVVPGTTVATVAGTSYTDLPVAAAGLAGDASMQNLTTLVTIGDCVIDTANSRCYVPTQTATGSTLLIAGWYEG